MAARSAKRAGPLNLLKLLSGAERKTILFFMFYVYVLQSKKDKKRYIGFSADLKKRINEHNKGRVKITKNRLPLELIYYEAFKDKEAACRQELFYKTGQGRRILKKRLNFLGNN